MKQLNWWESIKKVNNIFNTLFRLSYWWYNYYLLTIHKIQEHNDTIKFRYNSTYNVYWIFHWDFLYLYYSDQRNIRRTKDVKRILWLLNKKDDAFERTYQELFDKQLKKYFDNDHLMKSINNEISAFAESTYWKKSKSFHNQFEEFISNRIPQVIWSKSWILLKNDRDDWVLYLDKNWVTIKATDKAVPWIMYYFQWEQYYVAINTSDITKRIFKEWFDAAKIVTTYVTNFDGLFKGKQRFNQDITSWDTSNVTSMSWFLQDCPMFNQNIFEYYNTSKVTNMSNMLSCCKNFSYPLTNLDTSNVTNFEHFMSYCNSFDQPISNLNVEKWENFKSMFARWEKPMKKQLIKWWKPKSAKYIQDIFSWSPELKLQAYYIFKEYSKNLSEDDLNEEFWYLFENKYYSYLFEKDKK